MTILNEEIIKRWSMECRDEPRRRAMIFPQEWTELCRLAIKGCAVPEARAIDALMKDIGQYLWGKTEVDWILSVHHIPTEPVCPSVWLVEETPQEGKEARRYQGFGDTLQEAMQRAFDNAKAALDQSPPQKSSPAG